MEEGTSWSAFAGLGVGFALALIILGFYSVGIDGDHLWMIFLGFLLVFAVSVLSSLKLEGEDPAWLVMAVCFVVGCVAAYGTYLGIRAPRLSESWSAKADEPDGLRGKGVWMLGDTVVRVRSDGAVAYAPADGAVRWTHTVPGTQTVCAMSDRAEGGIGLIAYAEDGGPCGQVAALDLATGKALWQTRTSLPERRGSDGFSGVMALTSKVAVFPVKKGLRGVEPRSRERLWTAPAPKGCSFDARYDGFALAGERLTVGYQCRKGARIVTIDAGTGRTLWSVPLPGTVVAAEAISAAPAVVYIRESGERGRDRILLFTAEGRQSGEIPVSGPDGAIDLGSSGLALLPRPYVQVGGDAVYAKVEQKHGYDLLVSYGLDGERRWSTDLEDYIEAFSVSPNGIAIVSRDSRKADDLGWLSVVSPATGARRERIRLPFDFGREADDPWLYHGPDLTVLATAESGTPVIAYRRKG